MIVAILAVTLSVSDAAVVASADAAPPLPKAVNELVLRRAACRGLERQTPFSAERARQVGSEIIRLKCDRLDRDQRRLERAYADTPVILKALSEQHDWP